MPGLNCDLKLYKIASERLDLLDSEVECLDSDLNPCVNSDISVNTNDEITDAMGSKQLDFEEYVTCDDNVLCISGSENIITAISENNSEDELICDSEEEIEVEECITLNDGLKAINTMRKLLTQYD